VGQGAAGPMGGSQAGTGRDAAGVACGGRGSGDLARGRGGHLLARSEAGEGGRIGRLSPARISCGAGWRQNPSGSSAGLGIWRTHAGVLPGGGGVGVGVGSTRGGG
jgi:hypothetical protein